MDRVADACENITVKSNRSYSAYFRGTPYEKNKELLRLQENRSPEDARLYFAVDV